MGLVNIWVNDGEPGDGTKSVVCQGTTEGNIPIETEAYVLNHSAAVVEMTAEIGDTYFQSGVIADALPFFFATLSCFSDEASPPATLHAYIKILDEWATFPELTIDLGEISLLDAVLNSGTSRAYNTINIRIPFFASEGQSTRSLYKVFFKMPQAAVAQMSMTAVLHGVFIQE